jgi:hypothetical protein
MQLTENSKFVPLQKYFVGFFLGGGAVPHGKAYMYPFHIFPTKHMFYNMQCYWFQPSSLIFPPCDHENMSNAAKDEDEGRVKHF